LFVLCIVATLASFQVSIAAQNKHLFFLQKYYLEGKREFFNKKTGWVRGAGLVHMNWRGWCCGQLKSEEGKAEWAYGHRYGRRWDALPKNGHNTDTDDCVWDGASGNPHIYW